MSYGLYPTPGSMVLLAYVLILALTSSVDVYFVAAFSTAILTGLMASGGRVVIRGDSIVVEYGFPKAVLGHAIREVVEVFDVNELSRGRLVRYFKALLGPPHRHNGPPLSIHCG